MPGPMSAKQKVSAIEDHFNGVPPPPPELPPQQQAMPATQQEADLYGHTYDNAKDQLIKRLQMQRMAQPTDEQILEQQRFKEIQDSLKRIK